MRHRTSSGPEPRAAHLVRVGIASDAIRQTRNPARMHGRDLPREARHREIGRSPEYVDRADLAEEARAKDFEQAIRLREDPPEAIREFGVVGIVLLVPIERNRI